MVLKRLADAERDGDRIYAVIKGVAGSSDGRDKGLTAPRPEGQARALRARLRQGRRLAGHGRADRGPRHRHRRGRPGRGVDARRPSFAGGRRAAQQGCAIGSVKSMIGHTKCAAGVAGADQGRAGAAPQGAAADDGRRAAEPEGTLRREPVLRQHRAAAVAARRPRHPAAGRRQRVRLRRHQLPRRPRGVPGGCRRHRPGSRAGRPSCWSGPTVPRGAAGGSRGPVRGARAGRRATAAGPGGHPLAAGAAGCTAPACRRGVVAGRPGEKLEEVRRALADPAPPGLNDPRGDLLHLHIARRAGRDRVSVPGSGLAVPGHAARSRGSLPGGQGALRAGGANPRRPPPARSARSSSRPPASPRSSGSGGNAR